MRGYRGEGRVCNVGKRYMRLSEKEMTTMQETARQDKGTRHLKQIITKSKPMKDI